MGFVCFWHFDILESFLLLLFLHPLSVQPANQCASLLCPRLCARSWEEPVQKRRPHGTQLKNNFQGGKKQGFRQFPDNCPARAILVCHWPATDPLPSFYNPQAPKTFVCLRGQFTDVAPGHPPLYLYCTYKRWKHMGLLHFFPFFFFD